MSRPCMLALLFSLTYEDKYRERSTANLQHSISVPISTKSVSGFAESIENREVTETFKTQAIYENRRKHMSHVMSSHQIRIHSTSSPRRRRIITAILWSTQVVLALLFLFAGSIKLILPVAAMMAQMPLPLPLPDLSLHFIGI